MEGPRNGEMIERTWNLDRTEDKQTSDREENHSGPDKWEKYVPKQLAHQGERKEGFYFKLISDQAEEFNWQKYDSSTFDRFGR